MNIPTTQARVTDTVDPLVGHGPRVPCASCGGDIHIDHFAGVVKTDSGPAFVCDKPECLRWIADMPNIGIEAPSGAASAERGRLE